MDATFWAPPSAWAAGQRLVYALSSGYVRRLGCLDVKLTEEKETGNPCRACLFRFFPSLGLSRQHSFLQGVGQDSFQWGVLSSSLR